MRCVRYNGLLMRSCAVASLVAKVVSLHSVVRTRAAAVDARRLGAEVLPARTPGRQRPCAGFVGEQRVSSSGEECRRSNSVCGSAIRDPDSSVSWGWREEQDHDGSENVDAIGDDRAEESLGLRPETASICTPKETPSYAHDVSVVRCSKSAELPTAEESQEGG